MTGVIGMSKKDGGVAFPCRVRNDGVDSVVGFHGEEVKPGITSTYGGMSLRDYFAAKAMAALISHGSGALDNAYDLARLTEASFRAADAMLAERAK